MAILEKEQTPSFLFSTDIMFSWSPSRSLVWVLLPWLLSHTSIPNILLSQLPPRTVSSSNCHPRTQNYTNSSLLMRRHFLLKLDPSYLSLGFFFFSGFKEKNWIHVNSDWCFILWNPMETWGLFLAPKALPHSLTGCWWEWYRRGCWWV